jgi:hypothetical protein
MLESLPMWIAAMTFVAVIVVIMFEWLHITVAALLGALILVFTHIMTLQEAVGYISRSYATLALFFGVALRPFGVVGERAFRRSDEPRVAGAAFSGYAADLIVNRTIAIAEDGAVAADFGVA